MSPGAIVRLAGDPDKVKALLVPEETTVTVVEPQIAPAHALTVDVPAATPKTTPLLVESFVMPLLLPESLVTVATVVSEELQITDASDCVLLSLNVPVGVSAWDDPADTDGFSGLRLIDTRFGGVRVPGWYNSALVRAELLSLQPPATRTVPPERSVAVWTWRALARLPVTLNTPATGS